MQHASTVCSTQYAAVVCSTQYAAVVCSTQYAATVCRTQYAATVCSMQYTVRSNSMQYAYSNSMQYAVHSTQQQYAVHSTYYNTRIVRSMQLATHSTQYTEAHFTQHVAYTVALWQYTLNPMMDGRIDSRTKVSTISRDPMGYTLSDNMVVITDGYHCLQKSSVSRWPYDSKHAQQSHHS